MKNEIRRFLNQKARENNRIVRFLLDSTGYGGHWIRRAMNNDINHFINQLSIQNLSAAEISGHHFSNLLWGDYLALEYPSFDICVENDAMKEVCDILFCEQVLEHVWEPKKALNNLYSMLKPGGWLIVSTPFLVKIHNCPNDYWRFTPDCLERMLIESGFNVKKVSSWGNKYCVKANLPEKPWARYHPFRNLKNEKDIPVVIWAYAQKAEIHS